MYYHPAYPFHNTSTLAKLHQNSLTQAARHKSVASRCDNTWTATSGGSIARSGGSWMVVESVILVLLQDLQDVWPISG